MRLVALLLALTGVAAAPPRAARAFSVLAHQAVVDACWQRAVAPELRRRFPTASPADLERAREFAYGGAHVADLGYFPFGSRLFTDLVHYVRSGDLIGALLRDAGTVDEYAFALGALSHWVADDIGHPVATNRTVPEIYPKLRERYGDTVTYAEDHSSHLQTEFRFDVLQMTRSKRTPDLVQQAVGFQVAASLLDRAFLETYGLGLDDLFASTDVAITTYRWGFRELIHEATGIAWELYQADVERLDPAATPERFVADVSRADFEKEFGKSYREPGYFAKFFALLVKLVPNVGPLKRLPYQPLPLPAREHFAEAFDRIVVRYEGALERLAGGELALLNENLDVGRPTRAGEYPPADEAYAAMLEKLDAHHVAGAGRERRADAAAP